VTGLASSGVVTAASGGAQVGILVAEGEGDGLSESLDEELSMIISSDEEEDG
jgi:hypothetical protein